jgi:Ion channel
VVCGMVFVGVVVLELRAVVRDPLPVPRAAVAMARLLPLFIVLFAWTYVAMSARDPSTFSEPLDRSAALYFTVTVLSTVGFGDITPVADVERVMVSVQMICDLVVIAIIVKLLTGVAKHARAQKASAGMRGRSARRSIRDPGVRNPGGDVGSFGHGRGRDQERPG